MCIKLLVGFACIAQSGYLSDFNNEIVHPMFEPRMSDKFEFTENKVKVLLRHHDKTEETDNIKSGIMTTRLQMVFNFTTLG